MKNYIFKIKYTIHPKMKWDRNVQIIQGGTHPDCHYTFVEASIFLHKALSDLAETFGGVDNINYLESSIESKD